MMRMLRGVFGASRGGFFRFRREERAIIRTCRSVWGAIVILGYCALLSACGGGGGGDAPSTDTGDVSNNQIITSDQQEIARAELASLRVRVEDLDANSENPHLNITVLLRRIDELDAEIAGARRRFAELESEIARLQTSLSLALAVPLPLNCGTNERVDGQDCVCVAGYQRVNGVGVCEIIPSPPPVAECTDFRVPECGRRLHL